MYATNVTIKHYCNIALYTVDLHEVYKIIVLLQLSKRWNIIAWLKQFGKFTAVSCLVAFILCRYCQLNDDFFHLTTVHLSPPPPTYPTLEKSNKINWQVFLLARLQSLHYLNCFRYLPTKQKNYRKISKMLGVVWTVMF